MPARPFHDQSLVAALVLGLAAVALPATASACTCLSPSLEQHIRSTPVIFEGRVLSVQRSTPAQMGFDQVTAMVAVSLGWKGDVAGQVKIHGHSGYAACGFAEFPVGQTMLVLAYPRDDGDGFATDSCTMAPAFGDRRTALGQVLGRIARNRQTREEEIAERPGDVLSVIRLARHYETWQDWPAAARIYASAAQAVPELQLAHAGEGRAFFSLSRYRDAIPPLQRAVALQPSDTEAARLLGQARFQAGDRGSLASMDFGGFKGSDLDLAGLDLGGRNFAEVNLDVVRFDRARLAGARFARAKIIRGSFVGADLSGADLAGAEFGGDLSGARLDGAGMAGTSLFGAVLRGASLRGVSGSDANLGYTKAAGVLLTDARLPLALMHNADFTDADLSGALLMGAYLTGSSLCGANLSGANLHGADLRGARFNARTRFPDGFSPAAAGMVQVAEPDCRPPP